MYFPRPYPDEPTLSLLIRAGRHLGLSLTRILKDILNTGPTRMGFARPLFLRPISIYTHADFDDLLFNHTYFPYVSAFLPMPQIHALRSGALESSSTSFVPFNFLGGSGLKSRFYLRYCVDCRRSDTLVHGEAYWHRQHQLPGVFVCMTHGCPLLETEIPAGTNTLSDCELLPSDMTGRAIPMLTDRLVMDRIAQASISMLDGVIVSPETQLDRYQQLLDRFGGEPAMPRSVDHPVYIGLKSFYGEAYLAATNFSWLRGKTLVTNRQRQVPTLSRAFNFTTHKHVLLNIYLDHLKSSTPSKS